MSHHILIIEARYYPEIADELLAGATAALAGRGATWEIVRVPGVLEIPAALAMALRSPAGLDAKPDGFVVLGCVIRGETTHYDIVAGESARAIMDLSVQRELAVGNGIQTVENHRQAEIRAGTGERNRGAAAAHAALDMVDIRIRLHGPGADHE